jgi:serine/threonine protein kinase
VLPIPLANDPSYVERFAGAARGHGGRERPHLVRVFDIDQEDQLCYLVMEFVDGRTLRDLVDQHGPLAIDRAAHYVGQAALGLAERHAAGDVRSGVGPGKLMLARDGQVKVLVPGVDRLAPEQPPDFPADPRAAVAGLGATLYFLLTGKAPPGSAHSSERRSRLLVDALRPETPEDLAAVVARMLSPAPPARMTLGDVIEALRPWTPASVPPPTDHEMPTYCPAVRAKLPP